MDSHRAQLIQRTLTYLQANHILLSELVLYALQQYHDPSHPILHDLVVHTTSIAAALYHHEATTGQLCSWTHQLACVRYGSAMRDLTRRENGWHFNAAQTHPHQLRDFRIEDMIVGMHRQAGELWSLFQSLMGFKPGDLPPVEAETILDEDDLDADYWSATITDEEDKKGKRAKFANIKIAVILSILAQGRDPRCNALQSVVGIFCHACNAPEKLVKVLSKMGVSVSLKSVHRAIISLSQKSSEDIEALGNTLLMSVGFDNFDLLLKALVATIDDTHARGMLHMASGTLLRLDHGVTLEDLRCSRLVWARSEFNTLSPDRRPFDPRATLNHLLLLHPESNVDDNSLSRRGRFRSWMFQRTLIKHGPPFFAKYADKLSHPVPVDQIPVTTLYHVPLRAMDINLSTVSGNIEAIINMFRQAGIGDPSIPGQSPTVEDISEFVTLVHGDLGTFERVFTARRRRSAEHSPFDRLQSVVFVMGLFHVKMAAADTLWRLLVSPDAARRDPLGFYKLAARLRPNDSNHLISNAKFREQHELIGDVGSILRLNAWEVEIKRRTRLTLAEWAAKKPTLSDIEEIADYLVLNYVEGEGLDLTDKSPEALANRDPVQENTRRTHNYLLLYEELSYAMNAGDIGRVETLLPVWIPLFRAAGKHKYGSRTLRFMHSLYFVYPERLRRAIRYNILVNPTGKPNEFRAVDWIVEYLNLLIKYFYGGEGSNYTKERILLESVLVLVYRNIHKTMERNFALPGITVAHGQPNMQATFKAILEALVAEDEKGPNENLQGRRSTYPLPDAISSGAYLLMLEAEKKAQPYERATEGGDVEMADAEGDGVQAAEAEAEGEDGQLEGGPELSVDDLITEGWL